MGHGVLKGGHEVREMIASCSTAATSRPSAGDEYVEDRSLTGSAVDALDNVCHRSDRRSDWGDAKVGDPTANVDPWSRHELLVAELIRDPGPA